MKVNLKIFDWHFSAAKLNLNLHIQTQLLRKYRPSVSYDALLSRFSCISNLCKTI
jgi:hypothetical protein